LTSRLAVVVVVAGAGVAGPGAVTDSGGVVSVGAGLSDAEVAPDSDGVGVGGTDSTLLAVSDDVGAGGCDSEVVSCCEEEVGEPLSGGHGVARDIDKLPSICVKLSYCCVAEDSAGEPAVGGIDGTGSSATPVVLVFAMIAGGMLNRWYGQRQWQLQWLGAVDGRSGAVPVELVPATPLAIPNHTTGK